MPQVRSLFIAATLLAACGKDAAKPPETGKSAAPTTQPAGSGSAAAAGSAAGSGPAAGAGSAVAPPGAGPSLAVTWDTGGAPAFAPNGLPAMSHDGTQIAIAFERGDGARGRPNLSLLLLDPAADKVTEELFVLKLDDSENSDEAKIDRAKVEAGLEQVKARLAATTMWHPLTRFVEAAAMANPEDGASTIDVNKLKVEFKEPQLTIKDATGKTVFDRKVTGWSAARAAGTCDPDKWNQACCVNPAFVNAVFADERGATLLFEVGYYGTDSCWEPDHTFHVVRLP